MIHIVPIVFSLSSQIFQSSKPSENVKDRKEALLPTLRTYDETDLYKL